MIELTLTGDPNELSRNKRLHWRAEHSLKKRWLEKSVLVCSAAMREGGIKPIERRVRVSFVIRRGRALDEDNAASSGALKQAQDGLVRAGLLKGDTPRYVTRGTVEQQTGKQWRERPELVIRVEEIGD